jgi:hypothetical protein
MATGTEPIEQQHSGRRTQRRRQMRACIAVDFSDFDEAVEEMATELEPTEVKYENNAETKARQPELGERRQKP